MAIIRERDLTRREELLASLKARLNLSDTATRDNVVNVIADVVGSELESLESDIYDNFNTTNIASATNQDLDEVAFNNYGLTRIPATRATSREFALFGESGQSFGDLNNSGAITIPAGTKFSITPLALTSTEDLVFRTTEEITLAINAESFSFYAESIGVGSGQNVSRGSVRYHNFTSYARASEDLLKITNLKDISNGADEETDESLRTRCLGLNSLQVERNKNYIALSLLGEKSLYKFEIIESYYGIGTVGIILKGQGGGEVDDATVEELERTLLLELGHLGQKTYFSKGLKVILDLDVNCSAIGSLTDEAKDGLRNEIALFLRDQIKILEDTNAIDFSLLEGSIKDTFNVTNQPRKHSIFTRIVKSTEDLDLSESDREIISHSETLLLKRDEYVGSTMLITVEVL
jgi:hypothetical protein